MKKLVLSMVLLAGLTFVSCNKDDDGGGNCLTCEIEGEGSFDVCADADGNASVDGESLGQMTPQEYINAFCDNGTPNENVTDCVTCAAYTMPGSSMQMPAQEVCKNSEGKAVVNGQTMPITYQQYIQNAEMMTTCE